jgi:CRISPR/Cas system-associated exonuclease Cas4 (RecB family)
MLAEHITPRATVWEHDRSKTVGASEIGACARMVWYRKAGVAEEGEQSWGFGERGKHVEQWVYDRLKAAKVRLRFKQKTFVDTYLSATLDGMLGKVVVDIKSFDPRKRTLVEQKHLMQVQVQIAMVGAEAGLLLYVNASDYQDIREHRVERDPSAYEKLHERARLILTSPVEPAREGRFAGGDECRLCPYQTACLGAPIEDKGKLNETDAAAVAAARLMIQQAETAKDDAEGRIAAGKETIREILRASDVRRAPGLARISRSQRTTLDQEAMERAGIDLAPFRKPGRETETVTVEP